MGGLPTDLIVNAARVRRDALRRVRVREEREKRRLEIHTICQDPLLPDPIRPLKRTNVEGHPKSGFKGVYPAHDGNRWVAYLCSKSRKIFCGTYTDPRQAALVRDKFVLRYLAKDQWVAQLSFEISV